MAAELSLAASMDDAQRPGDWRETTLISVAEVRFSSVDKIARPSEDPIRLCNYNDVYGNDYITGDLEFMRASATQPEILRFGLQVGDVIITKDSETPDDIGIPAVVDYMAPDLVCGYHLGLIRPNHDEVDSTFLAKQLGHHRVARYFGRQANGLTRYGLPIGAVNNAHLWLPEANEQEAIGIVLRLVDEAIAKSEAVVAKLRQVRAGVLHDLVTRGPDEHGQLRDPAAHPEQFKDSVIGRVPNAWIVAPLGRFLGSAEYGISTAVSTKGALPVLRMSNFADGEAVLDEVKFATCDVSPSLLLHKGDVLFNRTNSYEHVGRTGIWRMQLEKATFASYLVRLNPVADRMSNEFLNLLLNMPESQQRMRRFATPAVQQVNINPTNLQQMIVAAPHDLTEQDRITALANDAAQGIAAEDLHRKKLVALKSGLTMDLLTGRVRVPRSLFAAEGAP